MPHARPGSSVRGRIGNGAPTFSTMTRSNGSQLRDTHYYLRAQSSSVQYLKLSATTSFSAFDMFFSATNCSEVYTFWQVFSRDGANFNEITFVLHAGTSPAILLLQPRHLKDRFMVGRRATLHLTFANAPTVKSPASVIFTRKVRLRYSNPGTSLDRRSRSTTSFGGNFLGRVETPIWRFRSFASCRIFFARYDRTTVAASDKAPAHIDW